MGWEQCRARGLLSLFLSRGDTSIFAPPSYQAQSKLDFLLSKGYLLLSAISRGMTQRKEGECGWVKANRESPNTQWGVTVHDPSPTPESGNLEHKITDRPTND
ncbi:predicted protein [Histoplasma capsulatum G186AR]|uniref:Uncharacterized protein n=1 Tax=Ajellomyces capsulatus (strain G186AR / H82 / ATCC MYA-2454 / RMSCC 2432) TaxID=447093 RepID=C0NV61_AJECG|nr:uncharacterized protein HCBG_06825 [Histoplasma capsulatum G186AR]EEH04874.1 predicted protein [Histoplasma capsulatum G186AR]